MDLKKNACELLELALLVFAIGLFAPMLFFVKLIDVIDDASVVEYYE